MSTIARISVLASVMLLLSGCAASVQVAAAPRESAPSTQEALPQVIEELKAQFQGKTPRQVAAMIVQKLGRPNREIGSGVRIPQWDVGGGTLSLGEESEQPPTFTSRNGATLWLIATENPIGDNVGGGFEMAAPPDPGNHGTQFWLGELKIGDGTYNYVASGHDPVADNFFSHHPHGVYTVSYPRGLSTHTLLESLPDKSCVAVIRFSAAPTRGATQPAASEDLELHSSDDNHRLYFTASGGGLMQYTLDSRWRNRWGKSAGFNWDYTFPPPLNVEPDIQPAAR